MTPTPGKLKRNALIAVAVIAVVAGVAVAATEESHPKRAQAIATAAARVHRRRDDERGVLATAAHYLGISRDELRRRLRSQATLAAVANSTPGRSSAGLIVALLTARVAKLHAAVAAGTLPAARLNGRYAELRKRVTEDVDRKHVAHTPAGAKRRRHLETARG